MDVEIDAITMDQTLALAEHAMKTRKPLQQVVVNVAKLVKMRHDRLLRDSVIESDLINIDGMGVVWGARLTGHKVPERVNGTNLMYELLSLCAEKGYRPYFFGAKQDILDRAIKNAKTMWPGLKVAGTRNGYFEESDLDKIVKDMNASKADCLFIAISTPIKENFMNAYKTRLKIPFIMGVGGSVDVLAGKVHRAPVWVQNAGLEWLYRIYQEPGRMWKRYLITNSAYAWLLIKEVLFHRAK